jgi:hypothetical protein
MGPFEKIHFGGQIPYCPHQRNGCGVLAMLGIHSAGL